MMRKNVRVKYSLSRPGLVCVVGLSVLLGASPGWSQPKPGDIFREFTFNYGKTQKVQFSELDPNCPRKKDPAFGMRDKAHQVPKNIDIDLDRAVRAEMSVEYWGGHIGTAGQKFRVNGHDWIPVPQPTGMSGHPSCYYRTLLGNNAVPVPLDHLRQGTNVVQFTAGPQIKYNFNWGFYWIYDFTIRVYYDAAKPHPMGRIASPTAGEVLGDRPAISAEVATSGAAVRQVDFVGLCEDYNWSGDGPFRQWQYHTEHGVRKHHIGTATGAPFRVVWENEWVPDQDQPMEIAAIVADTTGMSFMTPAVTSLGLKRAKRSVKMYRATEVPEAFGVRVQKRMTCKISMPDSPQGATKARLLLSTWSAAHADEIGWNDRQLVERVGVVHNYSFDTIDVPLDLLHQGDNSFSIYSATTEHAAEVNWPGPVLLVEFTK
ncbi:MAG: hypothetical protein MUC88_01070 [Planctomycetes bacterium]|nr:hypothetical protein [Planctomycetota bacterium]